MAQFKKFIATPKTAVSVKATILAPVAVVDFGTNYMEYGTARIRCSWTPTLFAYSEDYEMPGRYRRSINVIRDGGSFMTRTVVLGTNGGLSSA